uniref:Uncharacterized protein n=1 Tax=Laticauda laticaudata TaxID=8630 RepID=A0A8C5RX42_LATLA
WGVSVTWHSCLILYIFKWTYLAISYDSSDQTALYIRMLGDVRVRSWAGFERERRGSHPYIDFRIFHCKYLIVVQ